MMEERNNNNIEMMENNKIEDEMMPGFRFHPTDEEIVDFYLKRKIQQKSLPIELIKQVDIYKYEPWDLPRLASNGEKEWYFYCPRDRKYRNSARPNRVTRCGFWKATGTDRPIYSSEGKSSIIIGLKKSLVFYRGRAAKGFKTDWMMHEFRLPSLSSSSDSSNKLSHKTIAASDSWAICRIFKKANTMSMAHKASLSHHNHPYYTWNHHNQLFDDLIPHQQQQQQHSIPISNTNNTNFIFYNDTSNTTLDEATKEIDAAATTTTNTNSSSIISSNIALHEDQNHHQHFNNNSSSGFSSSSISIPHDIMMMQPNIMVATTSDDDDSGIITTTTTIGFPFNLPSNDNTTVPWDYSSEISTTYSTNKCYT